MADKQIPDCYLCLVKLKHELVKAAIGKEVKKMFG
jgi:hypothetical protein